MGDCPGLCMQAQIKESLKAENLSRLWSGRDVIKGKGSQRRYITGFEDEGRRPQVKEYRHLLEGERDKKMNSPLEASERDSALILAQ